MHTSRFDCMDVDYAGRLALPRHIHTHTAIWTVFDGEFSQVIGRREHRARRGVTLIVPAEEPHIDVIGPTPVRSLVLAVPAFEQLGRLGRESQAVIDGDVFILASRMRTELAKADTAASLLLEGYGLEIMGSLLRMPFDETGKPVWMRAVIARLRAEFQTALSLSEIAHDVGVHPVYFARVFRKVNGESVGEFVRRLRIEYAARQLTGSSDRLSDISTAAGFADQAHFCRAFRRTMGMTPTEFRRGR
jgi:AraC family transcriptional regulator